MSDINDKATITLQVNGQQAKRMLSDLEQQMDKANRKLAEMKKNGADPVAVKKQAKEVQNIKRQLDQMKTAAAQVKDVMSNLDKATPRQLESTLRRLKQQLKDLRPGTAVWDEHVAKIKKVQAQLSLANNELRSHQSTWQRFTNFMNNGAVAIVAAVAAYTASLQKLREYVSAWATMEESIWNSVKYTRMTREEVDELNESFKKMDTRLGREELNALAQEAGRLGKNTIKDVQEYVEAAQVINVALVDLGKGATQTIAKISNIFGIEQLYGVRDAMLKVGSTVNHLSQNCTAAKPYLVNFAQRLAGIGATAKMTVPDILAFGAVLDANGQKVEMSASAISRLIMMLFQKTGDIARTVGMDVQKFTNVLQSNTREGLMMFLDQLRAVSNGSESTAVAKLAPLFKDLGMDGIRMSQVIATLTQHMGELNWQFGEANRAFQEGKSASNEFEIFNNTAQAKIDKAKIRIQELTVELGEKLAPLMMHFTTTSTMMVKSINVAVDWFIKYKSAVFAAVAVVSAYYVALGVAWVKTVALNSVTKLGAAIQATYNYTVGLGRVAVVAFTKGLGEAKVAFQVLNATMKLNPFGLMLAAVTAVVAAVALLAKKTSEYTKITNKAKAAAAGFSEEAVKERHELDELFGKLQGATKGSQAYQEAKDTIIKKYGQYLNGLIDERGEITNLTLAYDRLTKAVQRSNAERGIQEAKTDLDKKHYSSQAELLKSLQNSLEYWSGDAKEAAKIAAEVAEAVASGKSIKEQTVNRINEISAYRVPKGASGLNAVKEFVNNSKFGTFTRALGINGLQSPADIVNQLTIDTREHKKESAAIEGMLDGVNPYRHQETWALQMAVQSLEKIVDSNKASSAFIPEEGKNSGIYREVSVKEAKKLLAVFADELAFRTGEVSGSSSGSSTIDTDGITDTDPDNNNSKEDKFAAEKAWRERMINLAKKSHLEGLSSEYQYESDLLDIEVEYHKRLLAHKDLSEDERLALQISAIEASMKQEESFLKWMGINDQKNYEQRLSIARQLYADGFIDKEAYDRALESLELEHAKKLLTTTVEGSKERTAAEKRYQELMIKQRERLAKEEEAKQKEREAHQKEVDKVRHESFGLTEQEKQAEYDAALAILDEALAQQLDAIGDNEEQKLLILEKYELAKLALKRKYNREGLSEDKKHWESFEDMLKEKLGENMAKVVTKGWSLVEGLFSQVSSLIQSSVEQRTAQIEAEFDTQVKAAEGNSYKIAKLEKEKERRIAEEKSAANRKLMDMQVIQAISQTAQNAITAWGTGMQAGFPLGPVLAPIFSGIALATGAIQIANIKRQQQSAASTGYAEGGFTAPGPKYQPAGVVHAGEWVASQRLLANPVVRPMIEAMEYVQRTNSYGSLPRSYVDRSLSAPAVLSLAAARGQDDEVAMALRESSAASKELRRRLSEPITPIVTVTGDYGVEKAQREVERYRSNASPKRR